MKSACFAMLLAASQFCVFPQSSDHLHTQLRLQSREHIADFHQQIRDSMTISQAEQQLAAACAVNCDHAILQVREESRKESEHRTVAVNRLIAQIHGEVDAYIAQAIDTTHYGPKAVAQDLRQVLISPDDEPASVFVLNSTKSRSLIVVYAVHKADQMGPRATSVTIRAYNAINRRFRLSDSAGDDMEGYAGISVLELPSPVPDEKWLLIWGQATGANGPNIRMRVYAYDGEKFRTKWMPENSWGSFTVRVTERGFRVDGSYYRESGMRHDAYVLASDGLYRAR